MSFHPDVRTKLSKPGRFRSAFSEKLILSVDFPEISPYTRQEAKQECDINYIMDMYQQGYDITHVRDELPQYLDLDGSDFRDHMDLIAGASSMFEELPAKLRLRFDNDPAEFLDFCSQEKNRPEMAELGLLSDEAVARMATPSPASQPAPTAPVEPPAAPTAKSE